MIPPLKAFAVLAAGLVLTGCAAYVPSASLDGGLARSRLITPLAEGDEAIVVTTHTIQTPDGPLEYEARAGRLPIRVDETGEVHAHVFFVAYVVKNRGPDRPLTVAWNGGPLVSSIYVHTEFLGPRLVTNQGVVDNPLTMLRQSDLVFYDPAETAFSRPAKPEFAPEFMNMQGDVAAAAEFVRAYRAKFAAQTQPLFLLGESYGVWRAGAVAEILAQKGTPLSGLILISGGFPSVPMPMAFWLAMNVQNRTATALYYRRLSPALMRDPGGTQRAADDWARTVYYPALENIAALDATGRAQIIQSLASYTGMEPSQIDPDTLAVTTADYLANFMGDGRELSDIDTRVIGAEAQPPERHVYVSRYLREELGYATDLSYLGKLGYGYDLGYRGLEAGYIPIPGPGRRSVGQQWSYNQSDTSPAALEAMRMDGEVGHMFNANPAWTQRAMALQPNLKVFVAMGRYDPTNVCEGVALAVGGLEPEVRDRVTTRCYEGGHMMFRDPGAFAEVVADLDRFIAGSARPPYPNLR